MSELRPGKREGRKEILSYFASVALAKPKLEESPSSEGWTSAFDRVVLCTHYSHDIGAADMHARWNGRQP
ncbi:MAG: hypothetical protein DMF98_21245 [Acidobacteria bacterium]|nr:MAG: hypothetical protein DMF98_21245 [Acidobacteriota bacterium]